MVALLLHQGGHGFGARRLGLRRARLQMAPLSCINSYYLRKGGGERRGNPDPGVREEKKAFFISEQSEEDGERLKKLQGMSEMLRP